MKNERYTPKQALPKIKHYCAYQERCHHEVKDKLFGYGLNTLEVDEITSTLVAENYLNEQRFAEQFAGGRFRMKHWGRVKIRHELKQKFISSACIKKALAIIDVDEYDKILLKLAELKWNSIRTEKNIFTKKRKVLNYLLQKGFESELSLAVIDKLSK